MPTASLASPHDAAERRTGLVCGVLAYLIWGFFPLLFPLLKPAGPLEILAHRVLWSLVVVGLALVALRRPWGWVRRALGRGRLGWMLLASGLIAVNWGTYIWGVNSGHVVEASVGYFINPLVNIMLGVVLFGERLTRGNLAGTALAFAGVAVIAADSLTGLWLSLALAFSFGLYGAVKKRATLPALEGLFAESAILTPLALGYVGLLTVQGQGHFGADAAASGLLVLAGVLTALPLWLFAIAVPRLPLGLVGMLQYLGPTIQFLLGLFVFHQPVSATFWTGLLLVWAGSAVYLASSLRARPRHRGTEPVAD